MWMADLQMHEVAEVDWRYERTDLSPEASRLWSLMGGDTITDYYPHAAFRDAVLEGKPLEFNVYRAIDTAAPAILASMSIAQGFKLMHVPNFRPSEERPAGEMPKKLY